MFTGRQSFINTVDSFLQLALGHKQTKTKDAKSNLAETCQKLIKCVEHFEQYPYLKLSGYSATAASISCNASSFCFWADNNNARRWSEFAWSFRMCNAFLTCFNASGICKIEKLHFNVRKRTIWELEPCPSEWTDKSHSSPVSIWLIVERDGTLQGGHFYPKLRLCKIRWHRSTVPQIFANVSQKLSQTYYVFMLLWAGIQSEYLTIAFMCWYLYEESEK